MQRLDVVGLALFCLVIGADVTAAPPAGKESHGNASAATAPVALVQPHLEFDAVRGIAVAEHYTGYKALPPGIAKNLARGKPLPPGIAKKSLPKPIVAQLPTYPDYEWRRCGSDLVLIHIATQVIAEVLAHVFA